MCNMELSKVTITLQHCRLLGYCTPGIRAFCEKHGLSLKKLCTTGWKYADIKHVKDARLDALLRLAGGDE